MSVSSRAPWEQRVGQAGPADDRPPSVLAVTSELPWPLNSGGHLRSFHPAPGGLAQRFRVRLISAVLRTRPGAQRPKPLVKMGIAVCPVEVGARVPFGGRPFRAAASAAMRAEPYVQYHRHNRRAVRTELVRQLAIEAPDVFYGDHLDSLCVSDADLRRDDTDGARPP